MQTVTRRMFLLGACVVAFHILSLNARIAPLMMLSANILGVFAALSLSLLVSRLAIRFYNKRQLQAMRNQTAEVDSLLDEYEPRRMPPGTMHEMTPRGANGEKLEHIRKSIDALEARSHSLDEATQLNEEIGNLHAELMCLWSNALGKMPFPKLR